METNAQALLIIILVLSPLLMLAVHVVLSRIFVAARPAHSHQMVAILSVLAASVPTGLLIWRLVWPGYGPSGGWPSFSLYSALVYVSIGYSYFHAFNMSETARRIRILRDLMERGGMELDEVGSYFDPGEMIAVRVERLVSMGQAERVGGRLRVKGRTLLWAARLLALWGTVIGIPVKR